MPYFRVPYIIINMEMPCCWKKSCFLRIPLLKEIQKNGKGLNLSCEAKEVETLLKELSSKGLFLATWVDDKQQADDLLKLAAKLTHE